MNEALQHFGQQDSRFTESREATKALVGTLYHRFPDDVKTIESWFEAYVRVLCGHMPNQKPLLTKDQIVEVGNRVMDKWRWARFPKPADFESARDDVLAVAKVAQRARDAEKRQRQDEINEQVSYAVFAAERWVRQYYCDVMRTYWDEQIRETVDNLPAHLRASALSRVKIIKQGANQGLPPRDNEMVFSTELGGDS